MEAMDSPFWKSPVARAIFIFLCLETIFAVIYRLVDTVIHSRAAAWLAAFCCCCVAFFFIRSGASILGWTRDRLSVAGTNRKRWVVAWLVIGLCLRIGWIMIYPAAPKGDGVVYYTNATALATVHSMDGIAWPPGLSLYLAPFMMIFGTHFWVTALCALLLFAATYGVILQLADRLGGSSASLLAAALFAVWPTDISLTGVNAKETLLALLVTSTMLLYLLSYSQAHRRTQYTIGAGILVGLCALTQPGFLLFPGILFLAELLLCQGLARAIRQTVVLSIAMVIAVLPWTYRNYRTYHRLVPISLNGGSVFYRANNPLANAAYLPPEAVDLPKDVFAADKEGYRKGEEWIEHHPLDFAVLAIRKQIFFLGDDSGGVYESMKRDRQPSNLKYGLARETCDGFWIGCWVVLLWGAPALFQLGDWTIWYAVCFLPFVYQWLIDSVFESGSRHHVSYIGLISIMVALALAGKRSADKNPGDDTPSQSTHGSPLLDDYALQ